MSAATLAPIPEIAAAPIANGGNDAAPPLANGAIGGKPANPFARRLTAFRLALCNAVSEEDIRAIALKLAEKAKAGHVGAARLVLAYAIGRPAPFVEPDTIDAHELATMAAQTTTAEAVGGVLEGMPAALAAQTLRIAIPAQEERLRQIMAARLRKKAEKRARKRARKACR